jgi:hypothetical protein
LPEVAVDLRDNAPLIAAGGGLLLFISLFIDWFEGTSAFKLFDIVDVLLALLALIAIAVGVMLATNNAANLPSSPSGIVTTAGLVAFSIVATFVLEGDDHKFGVFLGLIGTIAMIVGGMQLARGAVAGPGEPRTRVQETPPPPGGGTGGTGTGGTGPGTGA